MRRFAALLVLATMLNGCALAALPVVTGGVLATRDVLNDSNNRKQQDNQESTGELLNETVDVLPSSSGDLSQSGQAAQSFDGQAVAVGLMPAPNSNPYWPLISYALNSVSATGPDDITNAKPIVSAVLSNPSSLDGVREKCVGKDPAVLIDLDPANNLAGRDQPALPNPSLAIGLRQLRDIGVKIVWISGTNASEAGALRKSLTETGLDPEASDELLLMRYKADRKQTRRKELAAQNCIIAIAGGSREDFDELYEYLLEPNSAFALESIINNGWFITPNALTQN